MRERHSRVACRRSAARGLWRLICVIGSACAVEACAFLFDADRLPVGEDIGAPSASDGSPRSDGGPKMADVGSHRDGTLPARYCATQVSVLCLDFDGVEVDEGASESTGALFKGTLGLDTTDSVSAPHSLLATTFESDGEATLRITTPVLVGQRSLSFRVNPHNLPALTALVAELHLKDQSTSRGGFAVFLKRGTIAVRHEGADVDTGGRLPAEVWSEVRVDFSTRTSDRLSVSVDGSEVYASMTAAIPAGAYELRFGASGAAVALRYDNVMLKIR